jgi:hypothetical protein
VVYILQEARHRKAAAARRAAAAAAAAAGAGGGAGGGKSADEIAANLAASRGTVLNVLGHTAAQLRMTGALPEALTDLLALARAGPLLPGTPEWAQHVADIEARLAEAAPAPAPAPAAFGVGASASSKTATSTSASAAASAPSATGKPQPSHSGSLDAREREWLTKYLAFLTSLKVDGAASNAATLTGDVFSSSQVAQMAALLESHPSLSIRCAAGICVRDMCTLQSDVLAFRRGAVETLELLADQAEADEAAGALAHGMQVRAQ